MPQKRPNFPKRGQGKKSVLNYRHRKERDTMLDFDDFLDLFGLGDEDDGVFASGGGELGEGALPSQMGAEGVQLDPNGDGIPDAAVYQ